MCLVHILMVDILNMDGRSERLHAIHHETSSTVLPTIVFIVFVVFLGGMLYLLIESGFKSTTPEDPVTSDRRTTTTITCAPGQCETNIQSGQKTCPPEDVSLVIDPAQSVCNSRFLCDNPLTPYALQSDGSTDISGVCETIGGERVECPCLRTAQCPEYVLSAFTTTGNPYAQVAGQRITFPQISSYVVPMQGQTDIPPIRIDNPARTFCFAPISWLPLSNPGCNFVSAADGNSMTYDQLLLCMGQSQGCSGLEGSPCLQGTLAFITDDPQSLTQTNMVNAQLGCVRGEACPCDQVAIFDTNYGGIICSVLPPS